MDKRQSLALMTAVERNNMELCANNVLLSIIAELLFYILFLFLM